MSYQSIDSLQNTLKNTVFLHTKDAKKAAGRALGTIVEIITYYLLREWGLCDYISIERGLPEFGDDDIRHNVEFTLHPVLQKKCVSQVPLLTSANIMKLIEGEMTKDFFQKKPNKLIDANNILKNSCLLAENEELLLIANLHKNDNYVHVALQQSTPFAMVECKRVGVEEGCKKGPQTIEKAKQGAYVAQMTSALQKIWVDGKRYGLICKEGSPVIKPYEQLLDEVILQKEPLRKFILSIGVVSNHGNWFTSNNKNKEMKVLANAYDWLLFLTDAGLAEFVTTLLLKPKSKYRVVREAFIASYEEGKKTNIFTKTKIDREAHDALCDYFSENIRAIEGWFNVITPEEHQICGLRQALNILKDKNWR
ncbi:MAG: hypothetical protein ACI4BA_02725 [Prevotella sp.]